VLIRQGERASPREDAGSDPLQHDGVILHPSLGAPRVSPSGGSLPFTLIVRPRPHGDAPVGTLQVRGPDDSVLLETPLPLPAPDAAGTIRVVTALRLNELPSGVYTLRVSVRQGPDEAVRDAAFEVGVPQGRLPQREPHPPAVASRSE